MSSGRSEPLAIVDAHTLGYMYMQRVSTSAVDVDAAESGKTRLRNLEWESRPTLR